MKKQLTFLFLGLLVLLAFSLIRGDDTVKVVRVVDGDTIVVLINGIEEKVRLIGVDTPETKHPTKKVEYFGKQAAEYTEKNLAGSLVRLSQDPQTLNRDKYGRLLRYVWIDEELFNATLIKEGYAHAYTQYPFDRIEEFRKLEKEAREDGRGLWSKKKPASLKNDKENIIVCVTRTGSKYHRCNCSYLRRSSIPMKLKDAVKRYTPCSRCRPPRLN